MTTNYPMKKQSDRSLIEELLSHYKRRDPKSFNQLDAFYVTHGGDDMMRPDEDGDCLFAVDTIELMEGATVRVLIPKGTDRLIAIRQLKKLAKWLKRDPDLLGKYYPDSCSADESEIPF
jgi:hypothetical protein